MNVISESPKIYTIDNFLSNSECEHFINISKDKFQPALVSGDNGGVISNGRTGKNCWIKHNFDEITKNIAEKISNLVKIPLENAESYQIIYYDLNGQYRQHYDGWLFDNSEKSLRNMKYGGQRLMTALVYLNDVESGGGTKFTKQNIEINSEKGKLLIFENVHAGTNLRHELSEHAGMPVIKGEKWAFNLWFREESREKLYDFNKEFINPVNNFNYNIKNQDNKNEEHENKDNKNKKHENQDIKNQNHNNEIKIYKNFLSNDEMLEIIINSNFEKKEKSIVWLANKKFSNLIKKIESLINIDKEYFENITVTKYTSNLLHRDHYDAYDLNSEKGKKYTSVLGQRLITISGFISNVKVEFSKLTKEYHMEKGDLLIYNNCLKNTNERDLEKIKNYSSNKNDCDSMIIFNIYVREKSRENPEILKLEVKEKIDSQNNINYSEIISKIYSNDLNKILNIDEFKIINRAPIEYVKDTISKIKNIKDSSKSQFLNYKNLEKNYYIDEYNPVIVEDVINNKIHKIINEYFKTNIKNGVYPFGDRQSQRYKIIDEIITRLLHLEFLPLIEKITGKPMNPTYTYISAYTKGADLPAHTDRPECEYTCSYIIGKPKDSNWNIYVHKVKQPEKYKGRYAKFSDDNPGYTPPKEECIAVDCSENGLMIFNGTDHIHYREQLKADYYNVVLLHYCSK